MRLTKASVGQDSVSGEQAQGGDQISQLVTLLGGHVVTADPSGVLLS